MQTPGPAEAEVLEAAGRPPRFTPRTRRAFAGVLALVCVLGVAAWWVDARFRDSEARAVAACHDQALRADDHATTLLANMVAYIAPAIYTLPVERRTDVAGPVLARAAADGLPGIEAALERCSGTHVGRFHRDLADRRSAYVDYLEARVQRLREVAADGEAYYRPQPRLAGLRDRAFGD
jgi:hypothetical protein